MNELTRKFHLEGAAHWDKLADAEESMQKHEVEVLGYAPGCKDARIQMYRNTAKALRMQAEDGQWRCSCHLLTKDEQLAQKLHG